MTPLVPLCGEHVRAAHDLYQAWAGRVSYYFPIDEAGFARHLAIPPQVHPADFEPCAEASAVALDDGRCVGWIQAGYVSGIAGVPEGTCDALVRALVVAEGRADVAALLLDRALDALARRPVRAWRAFEHNCGYAFATGMGRGPQRMGEVGAALRTAGFQTECVNYVYATDGLVERRPAAHLAAIEVQVLPRGWSETGGWVRWDQFYFFERGENVGYATVVPVGRLIDDPAQDTLFMKGIAVGPRHRRRGIGHLIMRTVWEHGRDQGLRRIMLNTGDENVTAQRFYESIGFVLTDTIASYIAPARPAGRAGRPS